MKHRFYKIIFFIAVILFIITITSCKVEVTQETKTYKYKIADKVCIMNTFSGVIINILDLGSDRLYYRVEYITSHGTKVDNYNEFQLTAGYCTEPTPLPLDGTTEEEIILEDAEEFSFN